MFSLGFSSCGLFKKAPKDDKVYDDKLEEIEGKRVLNPETGKYEEVKVVSEDLEVVKWQDVSETDYPPITGTESVTPGISEGGKVNVSEVTNLQTETKEAYNVALVLPFLSQKFNYDTDKLFDQSYWALNYYSGTKLAFEQLKAEGVSLNVTVHDSKADENQVHFLLNQEELRSADLIIGGYKKSSVRKLADFAKTYDITYISPQSASANISLDNPNYLQISPTLESHCKAILRHARKQFQPDQIVLVAKDNKTEPRRFEYFNKENQVISDSDTIPNLRELRIPTDLAEFHEDSIRPYLDGFKTTVFLVPSFSDETFVTNFLRMLNIAKDAQPVRVYGLPQWMEYQKIEYDYFENLDVHLSKTSNIEKSSSAVRKFKADFYNNFGEVPTEEAYLGYDAMLYAGRMLSKYGTKFQTKTEESNYQLLRRSFDFQPVLRYQSSGAELPPVIEQFENQEIYMIKFKDYQFQKG